MENIIKRNIGIELLRIISMFMIVVLHVLGQGGVLANIEYFSANYYIAWFIEIAAYCAVNCFALITGYVSVNAKFRYSRIIALWLQVAFYTISITLIFKFFMADVVGIKQMINAFFPIRGQYWYFTAYFGLFFFIPFLNQFIHSLSKQQLRNLIITITVLFSILPTIALYDFFKISAGNSTLWLISLYLIGAYIKLYGFGRNILKKRYMLLYFFNIVIVFCSKLFIDTITMRMLGVAKGGNLLISYTSPFILFSAIFLFLFCLKVEFKNKNIIKLITMLSPVSFGVYLIHVQPLIWEVIIKNRFVSYGSLPTHILLLYVFYTSILIYIACSFIDYLRLQLFKILRGNILIRNTIIYLRIIYSQLNQIHNSLFEKYKNYIN